MVEQPGSIPPSNFDTTYDLKTNRFGNSQDGNPNTPDIPVTGTNLDPWLVGIAAILTGVGGYFVAKGQISQSALAQIISAVLSLGATSFVAWKATTTQKVSSLAKTLDVPKSALARHIVAMKRHM